MPKTAEPQRVGRAARRSGGADTPYGDWRVGRNLIEIFTAAESERASERASASGHMASKDVQIDTHYFLDRRLADYVGRAGQSTRATKT